MLNDIRIVGDAIRRPVRAGHDDALVEIGQTWTACLELEPQNEGV